MEKDKIKCFMKREEIAASGRDVFKLPNSVREILTRDINYCRQRILESQEKLENIQILLKLARYSSIKDYYENNKAILEAINNESLQGFTSLQHPTIVAAQAQLLKLSNKRSTRQGAKKTDTENFIKTSTDKSKFKLDTSRSFVKAKNKTTSVITTLDKSKTRTDLTRYDNIKPQLVLNQDRSSRFFSKFTLLIGNTSQFVGDDNSDNCTHNWCVYVRRPEDQPSVGEILQKVRFHLDASYKPNDVVEVVGEPFSLYKRGWGEFPINVEMFFKSNEKPISYLHHLKLDKLKSGRYCLETEAAVEVILNLDPNHLDKTSKKVVPEFTFKLMEESIDDVAATNIKNVIQQNYSSLDTSVKTEDDEIIDSKDFFEEEPQLCDIKQYESDQFIVFNDNIFLHCINYFYNCEYLVRFPKKIRVFNLTYYQTLQKCLFISLQQNKCYKNEEDNLVTTVKDDNITIGDKISIKRNADIPSITPIKLKPAETNNFIDVAKAKILQPVSIKKLPTANVKNIKPMSLLNSSSKSVISNSNSSRSLLKKNSTQSLLKSNHLLETTSVCVNIQNPKKIKLKSILCNNLPQKNSLLSKSDEDPKILIVRKGNSVLTTPLMLQKPRIKLSPERKLLGFKKNCDDLNKLHIDKKHKYETFENDVVVFKRVLKQLDITYIIGYALRKVPLYIEPNRFSGIFFDVPTRQEFKNYSLIKQAFLEIKRAKCIYSFLRDLYVTVPEGWNYVNILQFSREHGFLPKEHKYWKNINMVLENNLKSKNNEIGADSKQNKNKVSMISYSNSKNLIDYFDEKLKSIPKDIYDTNDIIDIEAISNATRYTPKDVTTSNHFLLPVLYGNVGECELISSAARMLGISFEPEQLLNGINHPSALEVLCSVLKCFVSDVVRKSLGICRYQNDEEILPEHIFATLLSRPEFDMLTNKNLGSKQTDLEIEQK